MAITLTDAQKKVADTIAAVARSLGVDSRLAVADAYQESKLDPNAKGDYVNGSPTSFGLFQLHKGGELGSMTPTQAYDPTTNATTALSVFDQLDTKYSGGTLAAKAQRPANANQYASNVDALVASGAFDQWAGGSSGGVDSGIGNTNWMSGGVSDAGSSTDLKLFSTPLGDVKIPTSGVVRFAVIVVGFVVVVIGLHALTSNAATPIGVVGDGAKSSASSAKRITTKTGTSAATVAAA